MRYYYNVKRTCESCLQLDAKDIKSLLNGGDCSGTFSCQYGTMDFNKIGQRLILTYTVTIGDDKPVHAHDVISVTTMMTPTGGVYHHFMCPCCGKQYRVLYLVGIHFRCRKCHDLQYVSTRLTDWERASKMAWRYCRLADLPRPDEASGFEYAWHHPRYQHRSTFYRLVDLTREYNHKSWVAIGRVLNVSKKT